jgi:hypothetical protein
MSTTPSPGEGSLMTNRDIENAAVAYVLRCEAVAERPSHDTRGAGAAGDVANAERIIEVKAYGGSARGQDLWLEVRQVEEGRRNPHFWVYVVENIRQGDPTQFRLLQIGGDALRTLLDRAIERRYFTVPWPVAAYDRLVDEQRIASNRAASNDQAGNLRRSNDPGR